MQQEFSDYMSTMLANITREAAYWKNKAIVQEAELMRLRSMVPPPKETPEEIHDIRRHG